jgi:predicted GIY-YIG superfamily endonuclease
MPRIAKNYTNTVIYKIVCNDSNIKDIYIGHTTNFQQRARRHKEDCIKHSDRKVYKMINDHGGWDNWKMLMIETCSFENVEQAKQREHYWYEQLKPSMNHNMPLLFGMTKDQVEDEIKTINGGMDMFKRMKYREIIKSLEEEIEILKAENQELKNKLTNDLK